MTLSRNKSESVESIVRRMDDRFHFSSIEKESTVVTERELHICDYDPSGIDSHTPGAKLDAGKIRPDLVLGGFPRALTEVCKVGTFGAEKYTDDGWLYVENGIRRYADAAGRHKLKSDAGELYDQDAKERGWQIRHDAQVIWNLLAALELTLREEER